MQSYWDANHTAWEAGRRRYQEALMTEGVPEPASRAKSHDNEERPGGRSDVLTEMKALRRQARARRHAYWFPLVLFGLLTCASVPLYVQPAYRAVPGEPGVFVLAQNAGPSL